VPKNTVGTHSPLLGLTAHCWDSQPIVRTHSPLSVLRSIVSTQTHCRCSSPTVGTQAHCWDSQPIVGTHSPLLGLTAHCWDSQPIVGAPVHCRYAGPLSVLKPHSRCSGPLSVLKPHSRCSGPLSVLKPHSRCSGPLSVPPQKNRGQVSSTTLDSAQQGGAGDGKQPPLRCGCLPRLTPGVGQRTLNHKRRRPDAHHATRCPSPHRVPTDQPRPEEHGPSGHRSCPRTPSGLTAHGRCPGAWSVLRRMVGAQAHCQCQAHGRYSSPWSVLRRMVGAPAYRRYAQPMVGTPTYCRCSSLSSVRTAHGRCPHRKTEDRRPASRYTRPNKGVQATPYSVRSAPASGRA